MEITAKYVKERFDKYNKLIFDGILPDITIRVSDAKTYLGRLTYKKVGNVKSNYVMHITNRYELPLDTLDDVIIHEMIHYIIAYNNYPADKPHGVLFRHFMNLINSRFGRNIVVSHRNNPQGIKKKEQASESSTRNVSPIRIVAVVKFVDGSTGIKVLPRISNHILRYYNVFSNLSDVENVRLFFSRDPFFHSYPRSSALSVYNVDVDKLEECLQESLEIYCDGKILTTVPETYPKFGK